MLPTDQSQSCIMDYTHLTQEERYQISTLLREGFSKRYIAWRLNRSPSTISREINRNRARNGYFAKHANQLALRRHCSNPKRIPHEIWTLVIFYLELQWSPEQIASRGQLANCKSIHDRPIEIEQRHRFGDLEIDTIVGRNHQQSLVSIVDRKTGYLQLKKCRSRKAEEVCQTTISLLEPIKDQLKTIIADNGKEFSLHEYAAQALEIDWYFADPYSAWSKAKMKIPMA